jgi:DNA invertase Pin-like site-specific DNA recombinase
MDLHIVDDDDFVLVMDENENINEDVFQDEPILGKYNTYPVDRLLDVRIINGKKYYLVKWEGKYKNTWEPEENINSSLIRSFLMDQQMVTHNNQITQSNNQSNIQSIYAHLYLRVSDRDKTSTLFRRQASLPEKSQNQENTETNEGFTGGQLPLTHQAYFGQFPEGNFSLDSQKGILMKYCIEKKMKIKSIEFDDGVSARNPQKLKGLRKIIDNISEGEILLILDLSRFSRNTQYGVELLNEIYEKGGKIYSVLDGMNYDTPSARHCVHTTISSAQLESDIKSIKVKNSLNNIISKGGYIGGIPKFGYSVIREGILRKLIKNEDEQKVLNMIGEYLHTYKNHKFKYRIISDNLNKKNINIRGKKCSNKIIYRLIKTHKLTPKDSSFLKKNQYDKNIVTKMQQLTINNKNHLNHLNHLNDMNHLNDNIVEI